MSTAPPIKPSPSRPMPRRRRENYKKGHLNLSGLSFTLENAKGSTRRGKDADGEMWEVVMPSTYGYLKGTEGADGDQVDAYIGEDPQSERVWVVDQVDADSRSSTSTRAFLGFTSHAQVKATYDAAFSDGRGPDRRKIIRPMCDGRLQGLARNPGHQEAGCRGDHREAR